MATYLFYPRLPGGSASSFTAVDLADDSEAVTHAQALLEEHASAVEVAIWRGDDMVARVLNTAPLLERCERG